MPVKLYLIYEIHTHTHVCSQFCNHNNILFILYYRSINQTLHLSKQLQLWGPLKNLAVSMKFQLMHSSVALPRDVTILWRFIFRLYGEASTTRTP